MIPHQRRFPMKVNEYVKQLIKASGFTQTTLAKALGYNNQSSVAMRLSKNNSMTVDNLTEMLSILGYDLVIQPKKRGRKADDQFIIDAGEDSES